MLIRMLSIVILLVAVLFFAVQVVDILRHRQETKAEHAPCIPLIFIEALTWFLGTFGVSDGAINMVAYRGLHVADTRKLPGTMLVGATVPLAVMSVSYLNAVAFSMQTLLVLIVVQAIGGFVGASLVKKLPIQSVRLIMALALLATAGVILARTYLFHVEGGDTIGLTGIRLVIAAILLTLTEALTMMGFGNMTPNICILLALGVNPLAVYPIVMTANTAGCVIGGVRFIKDGTYVRKAALIEAAAGLIGVLLAVRLVTGMSSGLLQLLMIVLMAYSAVSLLREYRKNK